MSTTSPVISPTTLADPTIDFTGIFADQTEDVILARMVGWANEGLDPVADADQWVDTREGGHWQVGISGAVRELARLYDMAGTEVPMAAFLLWAWGTYLDDQAAVYEVERLAATPSQGTVTYTGPAGSVISQGTTQGTVPVSVDDSTPQFATNAQVVIPDDGTGNGQVDAAVTATVPGSAGDVAANAIIVPSSPLPDGVTVNNTAATQGGTDVETDDALRLRALAALAGHGPGNVADYMTWAGQWPGVGQVKVVPVWNGPNSVLVTIGDPNDQPLPASVVAALQANLDPTAGRGDGVAPVGAQVTVQTPTPLSINVTATVTYQNGYTAAGDGNSVAVQPQIAAMIQAYLLSVRPGDEVVLARIAGIIATWTGVFDVSDVQINGQTTNITVGLTPPQSPQLGTLSI